MARRPKEHRTRKVTDAELATAASEALSLLDQGIIQMDSGASLGLKLVLPQLRLLVGLGQGNRLVTRLAERARIKVPQIGVTADAVDRAGVEFAIGALPQLSIGGRSKQPTAKDLRSAPGHVRQSMQKRGQSLIPDELMKARVLVVASEAERADFSWNELISAVANKTGPIHADEEVIEILDEVANYRLAEFHPLAYAFRALGVAVSRAGAHVLSAFNTPHQQRRHADTVNALWIGSAAAEKLPERTSDGHNRSIAFVFQISQPRSVGMFQGPDWEVALSA